MPPRKTGRSLKTSSTGNYSKELSSTNERVRKIGYAKALNWTDRSNFISIAPIKQKERKDMPQLRTYFSCPEAFTEFNEKDWMEFILTFNENYGIVDGAKPGDLLGYVYIIAPPDHPINPNLKVDREKAKYRTRGGHDMAILPAAGLFATKNLCISFSIKRECFPLPFKTFRSGNIYTFYLYFFDRGQLCAINDMF